MKKLKYQIARDLPHFIVLLGILLVGAIGILTFSYDKNFQVGIVFATVISYFFWGVVHHYVHHDLSFGIVLEYFSFALVGLVVILSVI